MEEGLGFIIFSKGFNRGLGLGVLLKGFFIEFEEFFKILEVRGFRLCFLGCMVIGF